MQLSLPTITDMRVWLTCALCVALVACSSDDDKGGGTDPIDTAAWIDTGNPTVTGGDVSLAELISNDSVTFITEGDDAGMVKIEVTVTPTTTTTAEISSQLRTCTLTQNGNADEPPPTCTQGSTTYDIDDTYTLETEVSAETMVPDTENIENIDQTIFNYLGYTADQITSSAFRDGSATGGYDILTTSFPDGASYPNYSTLITNVGTGVRYDGILESPSYGWWYDTNDNDTYQSGTDDFVTRPDDAAYATLGMHEADVRAAHVAGWNGYGFLLGPSPSITSTERAKMSVIAPSAEFNDNGVSSRLVYLQSIATGGGTIFHGSIYDATADNGNLQCNGEIGALLALPYICVGAEAPDKSVISDDLATVAGVALLLSHKFPELIHEDRITTGVFDLMTQTRGPNRELRIAEAMSPVGELK